MDKAAMSIVDKESWWWDGLSFEYMTNNGIGRSWGASTSNIMRNCHIIFQSRCTSLPTAMKECSLCYKCLPACTVSCAIALVHSDMCKMGWRSIFLFVFPWLLRMLNIYLCFSKPFVIPLLRILYLHLYPILIACFFWYLAFQFLYISPLTDVVSKTIFFHSICCHFVQATVSFS